MLTAGVVGTAALLHVPGNPKAETLLSLLAEIPEARVFAEIGCIRQPTESKMDGFSTYYLAQEASWRGGMLYSIELDPSHIAIARSVMHYYALSDSVTFMNEDGATALNNLNQPLDFLYLDGPEDPGMHLEAFMAAERWLTPNAIVAIDDAENHQGMVLGKATTVIPYAQSKGWQLQMVPTARRLFRQMKMAVLRR